jgi:hypothetical protein
MELREPHGECVPTQPWQTAFDPLCNALHELALAAVGQYRRNAWRVDLLGHSMVLKTLMIEHRFEEAHFEHDRIEAVTMERLTKSPHIIYIFGYANTRS